MNNKTTYAQAQLIKRTAWMNMQPRTPRPEDERLVRIAIRMLTYIACLNYAMCDLEAELAEAGLLRHAVKRSFRMAQERVQQVHQQAYKMLAKASAKAPRSYNNEMDDAWQKIDRCILLSPPERAYNIVVALARLVEKLNTRLTGRYDFAPARDLYRIPGLLSCAGIQDYQIDRIIEKNTENNETDD